MIIIDGRGDADLDGWKFYWISIDDRTEVTVPDTLQGTRKEKPFTVLREEGQPAPP